MKFHFSAHTIPFFIFYYTQKRVLFLFLNIKYSISYALFYLLNLSFTTYSQELTPVEIYKQVNPAVVTIFNIGFSGKTIQQGSGVVLNKEGWIVTNFHVFNGGEGMMVKHGDRLLPNADIIGVDEGKDLMILKVLPKYFSNVRPGNSDSLVVGQKVYAIGSPLGYENTMSAGLVSGLRAFDEKGTNHIQITAPISAGSSGGAVVNENGELIGVTTKTIEGSQNLNFAIAVNEVFRIETVNYNDKLKVDAFNFYWKGRSAYIAGKLKIALSYYQKVVELEPDNIIAYFGLANTYMKNNEYLTAISHLESAIALDSNQTGLYNNLALCYEQLGLFKNAITAYQKALEIDPKDPEVYSNIGIIYAEQFQEFNTAIDYYLKSLELDPNYDKALLNIGDAYFNRHEYKNAIEVLEKAVKINPDEPYTFSNLAACYYKLGDYRNAIRYCKKSLRLDQNDEYTLHYLGDLNFKIDDFTEALENYRKVIFINPQNALVYYFVGECYRNVGNKTLFKKYLNKALELDKSLEDKSKRQLMIDKTE